MFSNLEELSKEELIALNKQLSEKHTHLSEKLSQLSSDYNHLSAYHNQLQFQYDQLKRLYYGSKRERFVGNQIAGQLALPFDVKSKEKQETPTQEVSYTRKVNKKKVHPGRHELPSHLPVEEIILEPTEDTSTMKCIGKEITEQLEIEPAKLYIKRYIRPKYIKATLEEENQDQDSCRGIIAELPSFPIEKSIAGSGLLAQIMIDKFVDHLPIYRQIERFKREGVKLSSSTINSWQEQVCNLLEPLYKNLKYRILSQGYLQIDETPIAVLEKTKKGKTHQGYYWVYSSPLEDMVLFDYRKGRSREGPKELLKDFKGYIQTDGYKVYDYFDEQKDIKQLNCMAHARRGFEKALDYDKDKAQYAMNLFQQLYAIERKAKEQQLSYEQRHTLRLDESLPLLNELGKWMSTTYKTVLPKSPIGKAMEYCIVRWDKLMVYLNDGALEIDNNLAENAIRPIAIGRKNYLFAGSHRGAERASMFYSFFATCKKNDVNPFLWLRHVLDHIADHKVNKLEQLLPHNFKKS